MAADPLDNLRLSLMQDVLPVGMAIVERARRGGVRDLVAVLTETADPLSQLRQEGDQAARSVRHNLDRVQPGLGNPVMPVDVRPAPEAAAASFDPQAEISDLQQTLQRIQGRLLLLDQRLAEP
ncbi:MAG: hypothetical protein RLZZ624_646 [Cyanobacteriota bacterium]|jgi:hypothetical protein